MNKKSITLRYFYLAILLLLCACGIFSAAQSNSATPTIGVTDMNSATPMVSTLLAQTMAVTPASTVMPTDTLLFPTATQTSVPFMRLDGLRVAYIMGGDLYVQDSGKQAVQLTSSGQDRSPVFSDDGQKIVFFRESEIEMNQLYAIGADGTGGRVLVSPELLTEHYPFTEPHSVAFVPGTHLLLFNTQYYRPEYPKTTGLQPNLTNDLLLVDTDTGEIKQLVAIGQGGFFLVSPNGKWIAVQTTDHVDVVDLQGRTILRNLFSHSPDDYDCVYYGYICAPMFWKQDSSELILVQPIPRSEYSWNGSHPLVRTVWRYALGDSHPGKEIRLMPGPIGESLSVSPDGNWIAFSLFEQGNQDGVYLGNLRDGTVRRIYPSKEVTEIHDPAPLYYYGWSPDSVNFVFSDWDNTFIENIEGETIPLGGRSFLGWIDNNHYFGGSTLKQVDNQEVVRIIDLPSNIDRSVSSIAFVFVKP